MKDKYKPYMDYVSRRYPEFISDMWCVYVVHRERLEHLMYIQTVECPKNVDMVYNYDKRIATDIYRLCKYFNVRFHLLIIKTKQFASIYEENDVYGERIGITYDER